MIGPVFRPKTIMPLIAVGALLAGCGTGPAASGPAEAPTGSPETAAAPSSLLIATLDCPELRSQFAHGDLPQEFYDLVAEGAQVIESTSGTIIQDQLPQDTSYDPDDPPPERPDRMEPDPEWPKDSMIYVDPHSGEVVRTIELPDDVKCDP